HIRYLTVFERGDELGGKDLRFLGGGSITDSDDLRVMLFNESGQKLFRLLFLVWRMGDIDYTVIQYPAGSVYYGHFAASTIAGVQTDSSFSLYRRLHQQLPQVHSKHLDGGFICVLG